MAKSDSYSYLRSSKSFFHRLVRLLEESSQKKATPQQWMGLIRSFTQKGVKAQELEASNITPYFESMPAQRVLTKSELIQHTLENLPDIKKVMLATPRFQWHSNFASTPGAHYGERLYVLSSSKMQAEDRLYDLQFQMQELGFDPSPLMENPYLIDDFEKEIRFLKSEHSRLPDFSSHHFTSEMGAHGKNLMAHARVSINNGLFFVEEIQSDWAQRGRRNNWASIPKAPYVTSTESWAGLVLRDLLLEAALDKNVTRVAWIHWGIKNGGGRYQSIATPQATEVAGAVAGGEAVGANLQPTPEQIQQQEGNTFYGSVIPKMAQKLLGKTGEVGVQHIEIMVNNRNNNTDEPHSIPVLGFLMTDEVRANLLKEQPMYSHASTFPQSIERSMTQEAEKASIVAMCTKMLGSPRNILFVERLYDYTTGNHAAGEYFNKTIKLSLRAKDMTAAAYHEAWHFASENFLTPAERREVRLSFDLGSQLAQRTCATLKVLGEHEAAEQARINPEECAAHAFSLWSRDLMTVETAPRNIFEAALKSIVDLKDWVSQKVFGLEVNHVEDLFEAMEQGVLAQRTLVNQEQNIENAHRSLHLNQTLDHEDGLTPAP
jgi:hypothetical protein